MEKPILPKVLGIGAQKAGTSWLHENLKQNEYIWVPPFKEVHFFDHKFVPENRKWTDRQLRSSLERVRIAWRSQNVLGQRRADWLEKIKKKPNFNGNWYKDIFSLCPPDRVAVDVTPEYSSVPEAGIDFMARFLGDDFKAIYIIREPVDRAMSHLRMKLRRRKALPESIDEWVAAASNHDIVERGNYKSHVRRWQKERPKESLLFVPFGLISRAPHEVMKSVEGFIGVPPASYKNLDKKVYKSDNFDIPDYVKDIFSENCVEQVYFLQESFGNDFYENTR